MNVEYVEGVRMFGEEIEIMADGTGFSPSADRNRAPIADVLRDVLPARGEVLEVASGTGQHVELFCTAFPCLTWHPSEADAAMRRSIAVRLAAMEPKNVAAPIELDVLGAWPDCSVDAVLAINLLHIAAPQVTSALFRGASKVLNRLGVVVVYGPFKRHDRFSSDGDRRFDETLRTRDSSWGIRDMEWMIESAAESSLNAREPVLMPANNYVLVFDAA